MLGPNSSKNKDIMPLAITLFSRTDFKFALIPLKVLQSHCPYFLNE